MQGHSLHLAKSSFHKFYLNLGRGSCGLTFSLPNLTDLWLDIHHTFFRYSNIFHKYWLLDLVLLRRKLHHINYASDVIVEVKMQWHNRNNIKLNNGSLTTALNISHWNTALRLLFCCPQRTLFIRTSNEYR